MVECPEVAFAIGMRDRAVSGERTAPWKPQLRFVISGICRCPFACGSVRVQVFAHTMDEKSRR